MLSQLYTTTNKCYHKFISAGAKPGGQHAISQPVLSATLLTSLLTFLVSLLISYPVNADQAPLVQVANVQSWQNGATNNLHCTVTSPFLHQLTSQSEAKLSWILPAGTQVTKGQLLAEQDDFYLRRDVEQLQNDRAYSQSQADYASSEYARLKRLNNQQLVSASQLNNLSRQDNQAKLSVQGLDIQIKRAKYTLTHTQHFAPVSGQIVTTQGMPGGHLSTGDALLSIQSPQDKELTCEMPIAKYRQSNQLAHVQFLLSDSAPLHLKRRDFQLKQDTQSLLVYLALGKSAEQYLFGERLEVSMSYQKQGLSRIPYDALETSEQGYFVWQLDDENKVKRLSVKLVSSQDQYFLIDSSLSGGETLVTLGKKGLSEGQEVTPSRVSATDIKGLLAQNKQQLTQNQQALK
jgi:RND family efflux transporter MFP subunit